MNELERTCSPQNRRKQTGWTKFTLDAHPDFISITKTCPARYVSSSVYHDRFFT